MALLPLLRPAVLHQADITLLRPAVLHQADITLTRPAVIHQADPIPLQLQQQMTEESQSLSP